MKYYYFCQECPIDNDILLALSPEITFSSLLTVTLQHTYHKTK